MAIVQLINLVTTHGSEASEFWYADLSARMIKYASSSLEGLKKRVAGEPANLASSWVTAPTSWPKAQDIFPAMDQGHPVSVAYVVAWTEKQIAKLASQPDARLWIVQPGAGKVLAVQSTFSAVRQDFEQLIGGQWKL